MATHLQVIHHRPLLRAAAENKTVRPFLRKGFCVLHDNQRDPAPAAPFLVFVLKVQKSAVVQHEVAAVPDPHARYATVRLLGEPTLKSRNLVGNCLRN